VRHETFSRNTGSTQTDNAQKNMAVHGFDFVYVLENISGVLQIVYQSCLVNLSTLKSFYNLPQPTNTRKYIKYTAVHRARNVSALLNQRPLFNLQLKLPPDTTAELRFLSLSPIGLRNITSTLFTLGQPIHYDFSRNKQILFIIIRPHRSYAMCVSTSRHR